MASDGLSVVDRIRGTLGLGLSRLPTGLQVLIGGGRRVVDGQTLDPTVAMLLAVTPVKDRARTILNDPPKARRRVRSDILSVQGPRTVVGSVRDLSIGGAAGPIPARLYAPLVPGPWPLLVFYHGGGFVFCDLDTHDEACRMLAHHAGHAVLSVDYRLAPEHPFPAAVEDAIAAHGWAVEHAAELGADPARVCVGGDSAGGNLAAVVSQQAAAAGRPPFGQLLIYPAVDQHSMRETRPSNRLFAEGLFLTAGEVDAFYRQYVREIRPAPDDVRIAPLCAPTFAGLPRAHVVVAGFDVLRDEGLAYGAALQAAGVRCTIQREPTLPHGYINTTGVCATARTALRATAAAWKALVAEGSSR